MPKKIEHPNASLKAALELAEAVKSLGGSCDMQTCSEKLGKKGGGYRMIISAAVKFRLINQKKENLSNTEQYNLYKLSYDEDEKKERLQWFFLSPPLFKSVYSKYKDMELPIAHLDKIFIREFGIDEKAGSRISRYFIDGARQVELLKSDNTFEEDDSVEIEAKEPHVGTGLEGARDIKSKNYSVRITGQGLDHLTEIEDESDLAIVNAILDKIKRKLEESSS